MEGLGGTPLVEVALVERHIRERIRAPRLLDIPARAPLLRPELSTAKDLALDRRLLPPLVPPGRLLNFDWI